MADADQPDLRARDNAVPRSRRDGELEPVGINCTMKYPSSPAAVGDHTTSDCRPSNSTTASKSCVGVYSLALNSTWAECLVRALRVGCVGN